jgi:hypothetical protein
LFIVLRQLNISVTQPMKFDYYDIPLTPGLLQDLKARAAKESVPLDDVLCELVTDLLPTIENHLNQGA